MVFQNERERKANQVILNFTNDDTSDKLILTPLE